MKYKTQKTKYKNKNNPNYKHGKYIHNYCIDCDKEISPKAKKCKSCARENTFHSNKTKQKMSISAKKRLPNFKNKHHTKEAKIKISLGHGGTGIPYEYNEYSEKFNNNLKEEIRKRDNYECQGKDCSMTQEEHLIIYGRDLEVHHIDYDKFNCNPENLATTCKQCNLRANANREFWQKYFKNLIEEFLNNGRN